MPAVLPLRPAVVQQKQTALRHGVGIYQIPRRIGGVQDLTGVERAVDTQLTALIQHHHIAAHRRDPPCPQHIPLPVQHHIVLRPAALEPVGDEQVAVLYRRKHILPMGLRHQQHHAQQQCQRCRHRRQTQQQRQRQMPKPRPLRPPRRRASLPLHIRPPCHCPHDTTGAPRNLSKKGG